MELLTDLKFWMFAWTIFTCGVQWFVHTKLTARDVKELKIDFDKFKEETKGSFEEYKNQYEIDKKDRTDILLILSKDISYIKGKLEADNKIVKVLEKIINK